MFRNRGDGTFEDITAAAGLGGLDGVSVGVFADYDNDGFKDFFVSRTFKHNQLFHNNGNGTFSDVTAKSRIGEDCCTTVASWADYDNDGLLDLYVGRYLDPRTRIPTTFYARNGEPNQLYHNNGDGTFTNVTEKAGVGEVGLCLGGGATTTTTAILTFTNRFRSQELYQHQNGTFTDVRPRAGRRLRRRMTPGLATNNTGIDYVANIRPSTLYAEALNDVTWRTPARAWMSDALLRIFRQSGFASSKYSSRWSGNTLMRKSATAPSRTLPESRREPLGWFWARRRRFRQRRMAGHLLANDGSITIAREMDFLNNVVSKQTHKTTCSSIRKYFGGIRGRAQSPPRNNGTEWGARPEPTCAGSRGGRLLEPRRAHRGSRATDKHAR